MTVTAMPRRDRGWAALFRDAFRRSHNPMVLSDDQRVIIEVNTAFAQLLGRSPGSLTHRPLADFVVDGPVFTLAEWRAAMAREEITGEAELLRADGRAVGVQYAAYPEIVTGRRMVLFVALQVSRWGRHFRREVETDAAPRGLVAYRAGKPTVTHAHLGQRDGGEHISPLSSEAGARRRA